MFMKLWCNGSFYDDDAFGISPFDRGLLLGDGIFETLYVKDGQPECWAAHIERLKNAAAKIYLSFDSSSLRDATEGILKSNQLTKGTCAVRITLTRGPSAVRGLGMPEKPSPTLMITATPYTPPIEPWKVCLSSIRAENSLGIKSLNYLPNIMALHQAQLGGYDEAILCNSHGHVVSASRGNLFIIKDDCVYTPPLANGAYPGLMRARILKLLQASSMPIKIHPLKAQDLPKADAMSISNSLLHLQPVMAFEGHTLDPRHPIWSQLQEKLKI
jgi:branched-chain amino acid aminotransferase